MSKFDYLLWAFRKSLRGGSAAALCPACGEAKTTLIRRKWLVNEIVQLDGVTGRRVNLSQNIFRFVRGFDKLETSEPFSFLLRPPTGRVADAGQMKLS